MSEKRAFYGPLHDVRIIAQVNHFETFLISLVLVIVFSVS